MKYLPSENISEPFWADLRGLILEYLIDEEVFQTWDGDSLAIAKDIRRIPSDVLDDNKEPLFSDLQVKPYHLSPNYSIADKDLLEALSVRTLSSREFCRRVSQDLGFDSSRLKSNLPDDDDWNTKTAKKLLTIAKSKPSIVQEVKCIPLQDGSWASASTGHLYFPDYQSVPVPFDIDLRLVHRDFLSNTDRRELYEVLGVEYCSPDLVPPKIRRIYNTGAVKLEASVSHIRWLYHFLPEEQRDLDRNIPLLASDGVPTYQYFPTLGRRCRVSDLYFETEDEFGVKQLCRKLQSTFRGGSMVSSQTSHYEDVYFVNKAYINAVEPTVHVHGVSWLKWLEDSARVRHVPRLVRSVDSTKISELFSWLVSNRPGQIVGTLHAYWDSYKGQMKPEIIKFLREAKVLWKSTEEYALQATWIPTPELVKICKDYDSVQNMLFPSISGMVAKMPFLDIPGRLTLENLEEWRFLTQFGVGFDANTLFHLEMLRVLRVDPSSTRGSFPNSLRRVYEAIEGSSNSSYYEQIWYVNSCKDQVNG